MASVLIISFVEWSGAFQRPHHFAIGMARRGWTVMYACAGYPHRRRQRIDSGLELPEGLTVIESPALPGGSRIEAVDHLNLRWMKRRLAAIQSEAWDAIVFNDPRLAAVARELAAERRVFDCMDDLSAASSSRGAIGSREEDALGLADLVWTGTASLESRLRGHHPQVKFIPCGVDAEHFGNPDPEEIERAREELPPGEGPVAGYFGVLNERFDGGRVDALLDSGPWRVMLIGPATSRAPRLPAHPRLRWIGPRPYARLPDYLALFDLALIPYDTEGPHRFLYPVKALEYLAGGKPVLTTPLPDVVRFLGEFVELADSVEAWRDAGVRLLASRERSIERALRGQAYAAGRSWDAMVEEMEQDLRQTGILRGRNEKGPESDPCRD